MKKEYTKPELDKVEFTVAARLDYSGEGVLDPTATPVLGGAHDSGIHTACTYKVNSKSAGYANMCTHTNNKNSAGGSGIGTC